jgi:hypothetical protein
MQQHRGPTPQAPSRFRDLSTARSPLGAGFQFEFQCERCARPWRSAFTAYRVPTLDALVGRMTSWVGSRGKAPPSPDDAFGDRRARAAREAAFNDASRQAAQLYTPCPECSRAVCADCWNAAAGRCADCAAAAAAPRAGAARQPSAGRGLACPSCHAASAGGRFCASCGFDFAVTHQTCSACGAMQPRQAGFCAACGHGF